MCACVRACVRVCVCVCVLRTSAAPRRRHRLRLSRRHASKADESACVRTDAVTAAADRRSERCEQCARGSLLLHAAAPTASATPRLTEADR